MGYDIYASGEFTIPADKAKAALAALLQAAATKDGYPSVEKWIETEQPDPDPRIDPVDYLDNRMERASVYWDGEESAGSFSMSFPDGDSFRHEDYDEWLFRAAAPFCDPMSSIDFDGEDGYKWRWEVENGEFSVADSEVVYGLDIKAPEVIQKVVDLLYPGGKPAKIENETGALNLINDIEGILREGGFGPFAGLEPLDAIVKAVDA